jgi:hypothetical protein
MKCTACKIRHRSRTSLREGSVGEKPKYYKCMLTNINYLIAARNLAL